MRDPLALALDPDSLTDHELEAARWHPERETLDLAAAGGFLYHDAGFRNRPTESSSSAGN